MSFKHTNIDVDNLIKEYLAGKSVKQLAIDNGFSRQVVYRVFRENGITPRNRSESMYVRMAQTSPEERKRLALAANIAKRGSHNTPEMLHKRALAHKRFIGIYEQEFIDKLVEAGIPVEPQQPFLSYNLDIGCGNVAVEIDSQGGIPTHRPRTLKRIVECLHAGMNMIYVAIPTKCTSISEDCYKNVISLVKSIRSNPPERCQYWMVRRTGEIHSTCSFDFD
jgi:hypothetical protein